jgi:ABC-2 type transport system permease protein
MKGPFLSLIRFSVLSVYAPRGARSSGKKKPTGKEIAKVLGLVLLFIIVFGQVIGLYAYMSVQSYAALKPSGMQSLILLTSAISATLISFVLCFLTALSTYCSKADLNLLALPLKAPHLLGAKMAMVFVSDFALSFLIMATTAVIYGVNESASLGFYLSMLLSALAIPMPPLALSYLVIVPLVSVARPLRNKNVIMIIGGIVGLGLGLGLNYYFQTAMPKMVDPEWVLANYAGSESVLVRMGTAYPPALLAWKSMTSPGITGLLYGLAVFTLGLCSVSIVASALGPWYSKSLLGFGELRIKRVRATQNFFSRSFFRRPLVSSLFLREWRLMNREPVYLLNGPFIIVLMPIIMAIGVAVSMQRAEAARDIRLLFELWKDQSWPMLIAAAVGSFLGSSTSITCTALSRDAKALRYIKALPISCRDYMFAKFLHGFVFAVFGSLVGGLGVSVLFGLPLLEAAAAFLLALAVSAFTCMAGLWLDTANPRLNWDNPIAAMKQNINSVIVILGIMALLAVLGIVSAAVALGKDAFFILFFFGFILLTSILLAAYPRYAKRKLEAIEA